MSEESEESRSLEELAAKFISVTEASVISGLTTSHVRYLLRNGEIEGVKVGRNWLTSEKAIRDYVATGHRPGPKTR